MGRRKVLLSCFFDISRAYDQVWHARLLQKLQKIGLSGKIFNYIKTFLTGRSLRVRWKGAMSAAKQIDMGVPQRSDTHHYCLISWSMMWKAVCRGR